MSEGSRPLGEMAAGLFLGLEKGLEGRRARLAVDEVGLVTEVTRGIAHVTQLTNVSDQEVIEFPNGLLGFAIDLAEGDLGVALLGDHAHVATGMEARRTRRTVDVPVGEALLGRVLDGIGRPLDDKGPVKAAERWPIERPAPPIIARSPVTVPLQTGIKAIDAAIPIGRGQRQLILGDRQTGKSSIAVDALINQHRTGVIGIYCAIGQRMSAVARVVATLREHGALDRCVVVAAAGDDAPGLQFVAPYAATSIAEFFMERGRDVLIVYDDLTRHARTYRELSLLLRRPPGREAYPGDIFFIHSRLLERATHLASAHGGGSLTALPIVETQAQNIAAYIPTNLISITDGQVYLSPDLFHKGQLPAIDIGRSVSRVGGKAQLRAYRAVVSDLRLIYSQFEEIEAFARFGTRLDPETKRALERGRRLRQILKQPERQPRSIGDQISAIFAATQGLLDRVPVDAVARAESAIAAQLQSALPDVYERIAGGHDLDAGDFERLRAAIEVAVEAAMRRHTRIDEGSGTDGDA